jgi:hypothetical protein
MVGGEAKIDPHRRTIEVPEGNFEVYREGDRFMVGRVPDGQLLGFFKVGATDKGRILIDSHATGQLGLGSFDEARELLDLIGHLSVEHGIAAF